MPEAYSFVSTGAAVGDSVQFTSQLPYELLGQPEVDIRFVYHQLVGESGTRPEIAIDNIEICACSTLSSEALNNQPPALVLYPNPASHSAWIDLPSSGALSRSVAIFDITGKMVKQEVIQAETGPLAIDLTHLRPGVYLIQLAEEGALRGGKLIIAR